MNRREAIQRASLVLGYAITGPALAAVLNGCKATPGLSYQPVFFTPEQAQLIETVAEIIIPKTDTPGAKDAGVPAFIDILVKDVYNKENQENFIQGLEAFNKEANTNYGADFIHCSTEEQAAYFKQQHDLANAKTGEGGSTGWWNAGSGVEMPFIMKLKELTLLGFFTSEAGATQVLQYNQVPGPFQGCVPLEQVGKTWAT
jgi:gluconate 2-dehydrogenase gamma chain